MDTGLALLIFFLGCLGGLTSDLANGLIRRPHRVRENRKVVGYDLGTLGTIVVGGVAAFTFWAWGLANPAFPQVLGTALISGYGGSTILSDILLKRLVNTNTAQLAEELGQWVESE